MIKIELSQEVLPILFQKGTIVISPDGRVSRITEGMSEKWKIIGVETTPYNINMYFDNGPVDSDSSSIIVHRILRPMELDE